MIIFATLLRSQPATRHSNRKRKASQSQPSQLTSDPRAKQARQLTELLLGTLADAVLIGQTDSELQAAMAQWAAAIAASGESGSGMLFIHQPRPSLTVCVFHHPASGPLLLRPLCKMLFQLSEASSESGGGRAWVQGYSILTHLSPKESLHPKKAYTLPSNALPPPSPPLHPPPPLTHPHSMQ